MKFKFISYLLAIFALTLLFSSCLNRPREVLNRRAMERLMFDIYVAEATMANELNTFTTPEKKEAFIREVFRQHGITQAQWNASLSWYSDRIDIYLQMNDSIIARLQRERRIIDNKIAYRAALEERIKATFRDSYIPRNYAFTIPSTRGGFSFRLDSMEIVERLPYDEFEFRFNVMGIPPSGVSDFRAVLTLDYSDTTIFLQQKITENIAYAIPIQRFIERDSIRFAADSIRYDTLRHLSGFVRLPDMQRVLTHIQLYDIWLGVEPDEQDYYVEDDDLDTEQSWLRRLWARIRSGERKSEAAEIEQENGDGEFYEMMPPSEIWEEEEQ